MTKRDPLRVPESMRVLVEDLPNAPGLDASKPRGFKRVDLVP